MSGAAHFTLKPNLGEDLLAYFYLRAKTEGLMKALFWEQEPTLTAFLAWAKRPDSVVVGCEVDGQLAGIGMVTDIVMRGGHKIGNANEIFFREYQVSQHTEALGRLLLEYAFIEVKVVALFGLTPADNHAALRFMRHMGFKHSEPVPYLCSFNGKSCAGVYSWITREAWESAKTPQENHELAPVA